MYPVSSTNALNCSTVTGVASIKNGFEILTLWNGYSFSSERGCPLANTVMAHAMSASELPITKDPSGILTMRMPNEFVNDSTDLLCVSSMNDFKTFFTKPDVSSMQPFATP